jgi:uncharacterized protein (DUF305 family)
MMVEHHCRAVETARRSKEGYPDVALVGDAETAQMKEIARMEGRFG